MTMRRLACSNGPAARLSRAAAAASRLSWAAVPAARGSRAAAVVVWLLGAPLQAAVEITGVEAPVAANVLAFLRLDDADCSADERLLRRELADAPEQIRSALNAYGFYEASVETTFESGDECWTARFAIAPGDPVLLRTIEIEIGGAAADDVVFAAAVNAAGLDAGKPLHHGAYEQLKRRLLDLARDRGYPTARYADSRIDIYPAELAADVTLRFDSGPRYRFGELTVQQDVLREEFVGAYVAVEPGEPYNDALLTATYVGLLNSGYFDSVDVRPDPPDHEAQTIGVTIALTPAPRQAVSYGVGFSTDTGPRFRFGRAIRRWNDRGHQLGVNAQLSPVISELTANYRYPFGDPRFQWVSFDGGLKRENTETSESEALELGARRVTERTGGWSRTELLSLAVEEFEVGDQTGRSRLLMPGINWSRLRADTPLRPTNGSKLSFDVRGAGDALGSDTTFVQGIAEAKFIWSLRNDARIITRGRFGLTNETSFADLPPSVRFFAGGDDSIRGYDFQSLGPENAEGQVIGGTGVAVASFEYEHALRGRWSIATFVDAGNAFADGDFDTKIGAGIGARWQSPLGPIRIDIGVPVNDAERSARLHVSLGPDL